MSSLNGKGIVWEVNDLQKLLGKFRLLGIRICSSIIASKSQNRATRKTDEEVLKFNLQKGPLDPHLQCPYIARKEQNTLKSVERQTTPYRSCSNILLASEP